MSPAYCANQSTYDIYCQWCIDTRRPPPTREWWDAACKQNRERGDRRLLNDIEFDIQNEREAGWCYQPDVYHGVGS